METRKGANMTFLCGLVFFCVLKCFVKCEEETTIAEALEKWEKETGLTAAEAKEVNLSGQDPPIRKIGSSLSILKKCEKLSLATNEIETIENLDELKSLTILSIGRNNIKTLNGLEPVKDNLEELWISYNLIEKLDGVTVLKKMKVLYMSNNYVKDINETKKLDELPLLEDLVVKGNPFANPGYMKDISRIVGRLRIIDGVPLIRDEAED